MNEYKPYLMCDDSEKDGKAETMMDYIMSWCFRCASYEYVKLRQPILYRYCKYMLCVLLDMTDKIDSITFEKVTVWKQWKYIDLWVEVEFSIKSKGNEGDKREKHAILIENKYYTLVHDDQLMRYKETFDSYYKDKEEDYPMANRHCALITCQYENTNTYNTLKQQLGENNPFHLYNVYHLLDSSVGFAPSESDIFNEFFIRDWL